MRKPYQVWLPILLVSFATVAASAQSFRVQCPTSTITHPNTTYNNAEPTYSGPTSYSSGPGGYPGNNPGYLVPSTRERRHQVPADLRW